tara:strand:+ start:8499 stop:10211 length:1713 start_codon:yes stop_codon:yes gene_type:complete
LKLASFLLLTVCVVALLVVTTVRGEEPVSERLVNAANEPENWLTYNGSYESWRYSKLDQISRHNVKKLIPVWSFQPGIVDGGLQATPIVVDGVMYLTSSLNRVFAIDAATGKKIWQYYHEIGEFPSLYGTWNRGVAVGHGLVFMGTADNYLVALDAGSGREVWKVEIENGGQCGCGITGAPLLVKDKVIIGVNGGDSAHRGYLNAFDAKTGRHVWRFWTIPGPGEPGNESWKGDSWKYGGGSTWLTGSYDSDLNLLYWGVGNPAADFYGEDREGDNLYTESIIALDPDTGKLIWYYQQIPHDVWDFDSGYEIVLLDLPYEGKKRKLIVTPHKSGYVWVLDRTNGEFLNAWSLVENTNWIEGIDRKGRLIGRNEPVVGEYKLLCPGITGGRQWNHGAYSPKTGWFYSTALEWCQQIKAFPEKAREGMSFFGGEFKLVPPPKEEAHSHLSAYDPVTGEHFWRYKSKYPLLASQLVTAGDLLFTGDAEGEFLALDTETGQRLWSFQTGSGHRGSPITYSVNGKQYVATPSGWGSAVAGLLPQLWPETEYFQSGATLFVFSLANFGVSNEVRSE